MRAMKPSSTQLARAVRQPSASVRRLCPFLLLALIIAGPTGCDQEQEAPRRIDTERLLYPPAHIAASERGQLVAMVTDGESRRLALYRADSLGETWERWQPLPTSASSGDVGLTVAGETAVAVGAAERRIWSITVALDAAGDEGADEAAPMPPAEASWFDAGAPVLALAIDASAPDTSGTIYTHLVYLMRRPEPGDQCLAYRRSVDAGRHWSPPETLATGSLGRPGLFARSERANIVDLCYARDGFMAWRGSGNHGDAWVEEKSIRLATWPGSPNAIARKDPEVLTIVENELHQVAGSTSLNRGYNWERAIAIARACDHVRLPALDCGGGLFWVAFSQGDTLVVLRSTKTTLYPKQWNRGIVAARACCMGAPDVLAMPDSTAGVLFGTPDGEVFFTRVRQPTRR